MKKITSSAFDYIQSFEKLILDTKKYSMIALESDLHQLRDFRKDTYAEFTRNLESENFNTSILFDEYDKYCDFVLELLTTKDLTNTTLTKILNNFLNEYEFIKPFDTEKLAYNSTINSLDYLTKHPCITSEKSGTNNLKTIYSLINEFIHNQNREVEPNQE